MAKLGYNPTSLMVKREKYAMSIKNKTIYGPDLKPQKKASPKQISYMQGYLDCASDNSKNWCYMNKRKPKERPFRKKRYSYNPKPKKYGPDWL